MNAPSVGEDDSIPIGWVTHHQFCPRRAWLEASGERVRQSSQMEQGHFEHRRAHDPQASGGSTVRGIDVRSSSLGVHGRIDVAEGDPETGVVLVEYKATPVRRIPEVTSAHRIQLTLQRKALEEAGIPVIDQAVYFTGHRRRVFVELNDEDHAAARQAVEATRATVSASSAPEPLEDDPRCRSCSHASICLPEERVFREIPRRISVPDPEGAVLHAATYGSRISLSSGRVLVKKRDEQLASVPLEKVQAVVVHGNVDLSGAMIRECLWRDLPIVWCTGSGKVVGWAQTAHTVNGLARVEQHVASARGDLALASEFITAKTANQATIARRYGAPEAVVKRLRALQREAKSATSLTALMGVEGQAAAVYFAQIPKFLHGFSERKWLSDFPGRVGRGAVDAVNTALNYAYGMLTAEAIRAVAACGLDPHAGFLHSSGRNKPALALDLMEEFRAPVADSAVFRAFNNGELREGSFDISLGSARLTDQGRKAIIHAVEQRINAQFRHPLFGYTVTWRRALEIQARLILGVIDGTQPMYRGVITR